MPPSPQQMAERIRTDITRNLRRARNGVRLATKRGGPPTAQTPKDVVWSREKVRLWRYRSPKPTGRTPVLIVHSLVSRSYLFDLTPGNSVVQRLIADGHDIYLTDWGVPDALEAANTIETYTDRYLPSMVDAVRSTSSSPDVNLVGYCFGGVLSLLYLAGHPGAPVRSLTTVATPINFTEMTVMNKLLDKGRVQPRDLLDASGNVPPEVMLRAFKVLQPTADVTAYVNLFQHLDSDDFVAAYQLMTGWATDHIPFPGGVFTQLVELLFRENRLASGRVPLAGGVVSLDDISVPVLNIAGTKDHIVPLAATAALTGLVGSDQTRDLQIAGGHVGLFVGGTARKGTLPAISGWLDEHEEAHR